MNILIKNTSVFLPTGEVKVCDVAIEGDRIKYVGEVPADFQADCIIDGTDKFMTPGFINSHTHASMTLLRSYADDMNLMEWLNNKIWPIEAKMNREDIYWGAQLAAVEMIKSGTTCFNDMYTQFMDEVARTTIESGLRGVLCRVLFGFSDQDGHLFNEGVSLFNNYNGAGDGRVKVMIGPHAPYTCHPEYLSMLGEEAKKLGAEIHIHMAETENEIETIQKQYGMRPFAYVESTGLFENGTLAAHCVHLNDEDFEIIKKHNIRVAHNPVSNMKLASGSCQVSRLLKEGVTVGLGTDGASSNNNLDMIEEMKFAAVFEKGATFNPLAVSALDALNMATKYGAKVVGIDDIGRIAPGFKADLVLHDLNNAEWCPRHNLVSLLVYSASKATVDTVICNGKILMENRTLITLDEEMILRKASECTKKLLAR